METASEGVEALLGFSKEDEAPTPEVFDDEAKSAPKLQTGHNEGEHVTTIPVDLSTPTPLVDHRADESKASASTGAKNGSPPLADANIVPSSVTGSRKMADERRTPSSDTKERDSFRLLPILATLYHTLAPAASVLKKVRKRSSVSMMPLETSSTESSTLQRGTGYHSLILGILLAGGTSAVLSLVNVIIKRLETVSSLEILTFMAFGVFIGILPAATEEVQPFGPKRAQPLLFVRTVLSLGSAALRLSSLSYLTIADSSIITCLTPLMVAITASLFLAEPCHWTQGAAAALSILGVALVVKPPFLATTGASFTQEQYIGIAYGLSHTILNGVITVCIRATRGVSRSVVVFHYGCLSMLLVSIVSVAMGRLKIFYDGSQIGYLLLISHLTFAVQMFLCKALQMESATIVTVVKTTSDVIFGFIMQAVFLNVQPDIFSLLGGTFVLFGVLIIGLRKIAEAAMPGSNLRRRLRFLL
ncbi:solute carrier family 35 member G1-like [Amblyomma americanum]